MKDQKERAKGKELMAVLSGASRWAALEWDSLAVMRSMEPGSVDLVLGSPPYEAARKYGKLEFDKKGQEWVDWFVPFVEAAVRISKGLAIFVIGHGQTSSYSWSGAPVLLMADLIRKGVSLRCPLIYRRDGVFGSGGKDYFRYNYEFVLVAQAQPGKVPWANNCAGGQPPRYGPGGEASNRLPSGRRVNQWGGSASGNGDGFRRPTDDDKPQTKKRPSHMTSTLRQPDGTKEEQNYKPPVLANPGTVLQQTYTAEEVDSILEAAEMALLSDHKVGGGHMGHKLAHQNEAPYPLTLAERYVLSFCPPDGIVFDPFLGSGTTLHAAIENKRRAIGCDLRGDQVALARRRVGSVTPNLVVLTDEQYLERMAAKNPPAAGQDHPAESPSAGVCGGVAGDQAGDRPGVAPRPPGKRAKAGRPLASLRIAPGSGPQDEGPDG